MNAHLLIVGDEILIGQVLDTNSGWMATQLNLNGIRVNEIHTVGDTADAIRSAVENSFAKADLVLMTGGLGPTKDDITKKILSEFFESEMAYHDESHENIKALFAKFKREMTDDYRGQCFMPVKATIIKNPVGTAPGMLFERDGKVLVSMPGVPMEMKWLMSNEVIPRLRAKYPSSPIVHKTILTIGTGETQLSNTIEAFELALPAHVKLAYLPYLGGVRLRLTARGEDEAALKAELEQLSAQLVPLIEPSVFGYETDTLESVIGELLKAKGLQLGLSESCTGGNIAHKITTIPGSSAYFKGGVVVYSNALKELLLGVKRETLDAHGAVSEETALEMLKGTIERLGVDVGMSITGILGPGGGRPDKPVGTVWVAVGNKTVQKAKALHFGRDRESNAQMATTTALNLLRKFLIEH